MDTRRPHEIRDERTLAPQDRRRFYPITTEEALALEGMSEDERGEWVAKNASSKERLARVLERAGLPWLAQRARDGLYDDFESSHPTPKVLLDRDLRKHARYDLCRRVRDGEFDSTREEAERWAQAQTGEVGEILKRLRDGR